MKSDIINVSSRKDRTDEVLDISERVSAYHRLSHKNAIYLRLLAEEMMSLMRAIAGDVNGKFWIETTGGNAFELHLLVRTKMDSEKRMQLLRTSTSGKNEAHRGFMGKLRAFFEPVEDMPLLYEAGADDLQMAVNWSMQAYQNQIRQYVKQNRQGAAEAWDELERSVVAHVADEVRVRIEGYDVELIVFKTV